MREKRRKSPVTVALLTIFGMLLSAGAIIGLPRAYVGYHQWQANRAISDFVANGQTAASINRAEYHLDRLVAVGKFDEFEYEFKHIDSALPAARSVVQAITSRNSPPHEAFESPAGQVGRKLRISVVCRPEDIDDWEAFVKAMDAP